MPMFPRRIFFCFSTGSWWTLVFVTLFFSTCGHDQRALFQVCACTRYFFMVLYRTHVIRQCMRFRALVPTCVCVWCLHVKPVSGGRGAWASGAAENLSPSCQAAFKVFSSCSSGCSQPRPHPRVSRRYVTVPAGRTKGTHSDSDRH